ncbi:MAG TPA: hypothetical protein VGN90_07080 [Pyrinomonadaceae bacterium]|jgi:hypothetical protein|nr:hypothetical protein [Pyrinomonadaceae bacterium]
MSERSIVAFEHYRDASQRFEYFILGVSGALCAYIGQHLTPHKIGLTPYTLELLSLLLLVGSVFVGFKRIEKIIVCHVLNHRLLYLNEERGQLVTNFKGQPLVNASSGESFSAKATARRISELHESIPALQEQFDRAAVKGNTYYKVRNWLLAAGFLGLLISKILIPYLP